MASWSVCANGTRMSGTYHESNHNTHYDLCWYGVSSAVKHLAVREPYYYRSSCITSWNSVYHYKSSYHWFCWCLRCPFVLPCLLPLMETYILPMTMKIKNKCVAICTLSLISNQNTVIISAFPSLCIRKLVITIEASGNKIVRMTIEVSIEFSFSVDYLEVAGNLANLFMTSPLPILLLVYGPIFVSIRCVRSGNDCDCNVSFCRPK